MIWIDVVRCIVWWLEECIGKLVIVRYGVLLVIGVVVNYLWNE